ncbi:hypothetical protein SNEBB_004327 [Seison nebaliae]|nr:hypothetical protein SNEBB_004327 [Seison nebaliae]
MILLTGNRNNGRPFDAIFRYHSNNVPPPPSGHQIFCLITACLISYIQAKLRTWYAANARVNANNHNNDMLLGNWLSELTRFTPPFNFSPEAPAPIHFHQHSQQVSGDANDDFNEFLNELQHQSTRVNIGDDKCPSYQDICGQVTSDLNEENINENQNESSANEVRIPLLDEEDDRTTEINNIEVEFTPTKKKTQKHNQKKQLSTLQPLIHSSSDNDSESSSIDSD